MSAQAVGWTWEHSPLRGTQLLVHLALADVANDLHGNELWLTQGVLAAKARTTAKTVRETLEGLVAGGYLEELDPRPTRAGGRPVRQFRFLMPMGSQSPLPLPSMGSQSPSQWGPSTDCNGEPVPIELKLEPKGEHNACDEARDDPSYGWDRFWASFPQRDGRRGNKARALAIWRRMPYPQKAEAWRQLQEYRVICQRGRPPMDAERWLRDGDSQEWDPAEGWDASRPGLTVVPPLPAATEPQEPPDFPDPPPAPEGSTPDEVRSWIIEHDRRAMDAWLPRLPGEDPLARLNRIQLELGRRGLAQYRPQLMGLQ